ncbi:MAG TPA: amidase family protein [Steroidobacteraceae bacterium]|nr:amidase family protein [Steroidobacteraceae bacterium]
MNRKSIQRSFTRRDFMQQSSLLALAATVAPLVSGATPPRPARAGLTDLTATEAVTALRNGDVKAEDYAQALLSRAEELSALNAFITLRPDEVMQAARAADQLRARGGRLGLLHGLPIAVKDSIDTKSLPTSNGTRALKGFTPKADAPVLRPLLAEGAIVMGKTNLHELSCGWTSNNATFGPVLNPYDRTRTPGGSSGGSAAAVAARFAPIAIGEDTFGSIRVPSTFCGLVGLRPTFERYPDGGMMPLSHRRFDQVGPLARSVADILLFDSVLTGEHSAVSAAPLEGVRIGTSEYLMQGIDAECGRIVTAAIERLKAAGAQIVPVELPASLRGAVDVELPLLRNELFPGMTSFLAEEGTGVTLDQLLSQAGANLRGLLNESRHPLSEEEYRRQDRKQRQMKAEAIAFWRANRIDLLAFAPSLTPAFPQGDPATLQINGQPMPPFTAIGRQVAIGSCASLSCLVLPAGITAAGLPVGLEFDAQPGMDRKLLGIGLSLEKVLGPIPAPRLQLA